MKSQYESTFDDFDELAIQFGYAALFVVAFPVTPLLALVNNFFEIRLDASKLALVTRRPEPRGAMNIGTWFSIFNIVGFIAVMTNCGIIIFVSQDTIRKVTTLPGVQFVIFLVLEHLLFLLKFAIDFFVPDQPAEVEEHLLRQAYIVDVLINELHDPHAEDPAGVEARARENTRDARKERTAAFYNFETIDETFSDVDRLDHYSPLVEEGVISPLASPPESPEGKV